MSSRNWKLTDEGRGFAEYTLKSWRFFHDFYSEKMRERVHFIWRGQSKASWELRPGFARVPWDKPPGRIEALAKDHLKRFQMASRGKLNLDSRLSIPATNRAMQNEWWAIGQHYGLKTPLLDWTNSPYVALFFAFRNANPEEKPESRAVWALYLPSTLRRKKIEIVNTAYQYNTRVVAQSGLFTRVDLRYSMEEWIEKNVEDDGRKYLIKVLIPEDAESRRDCLLLLNKMNINEQSLFPDIHGAADRCNMALELGSRYFPLVGDIA